MNDFIENNKPALQEDSRISIQGLQESIKVAEINVKWHEQNVAEVTKWLEDKFGDDNGNGQVSI